MVRAEPDYERFIRLTGRVNRNHARGYAQETLLFCGYRVESHGNLWLVRLDFKWRGVSWNRLVGMDGRWHDVELYEYYDFDLPARAPLYRGLTSLHLITVPGWE